MCFVLKVNFFEIGEVDDSLLEYAVIVSRYMDKWVFVRIKPENGKFWEENEAIIDTAKRELFEETGAIKFELKPICVYSIESYGLLLYANITEFANLPESEIERIDFFQEIPNELSFPRLHPKQVNKVKEILQIV